MVKPILTAVFSFSLCWLYAQDIQPLFPVNVKHDIEDPEAVFAEVKDLILTNYYSDKITEDDLYWAAIKGMLRHISPPENPNLATIVTAKQYEEIANRLKGVGVSLGITSTFNSRDGSLTVSSVQPNSAADGLIMPFDRILRVDGKPLTGLSDSEAKNLLKGELDSKITLTVIRDIQVFDIELTVKSYQIKNLVVSIIPNSDIALIEVKKIYLNLHEDLRDELIQLKDQGISKIILDLRNNTGGVLNEGIRVANLFLSKNNVIIRTVSRSKQTPIGASGNNDFNFELIILINGKTASSSEIIVSALQDHQRAIIVGSKTYGKGVIETTHTLSNEYRVKFITSAMYSPLGKSWHSKGVLPDFLVEQSDREYASVMKLALREKMKKDVYLITALKVLRKN